MNRCFCIVLLCIGAFFNSYAGLNTPFQRYLKSDGLPSNTIYDVYRDSHGYLWIATDKGVARFNGTRFWVYTTADGLPDNEIFSFREDPSGRLWLATFNGELCYYKNDTFHNARNTPFLKMPFKASFIKTIRVEADSTVTFVFADQIKFVNIKNEKCSFFFSTAAYHFPSISNVVKQNSNSYRLEFYDKIIFMDSLSRIVGVQWLYDYNRRAYMYCQDQEYSFDMHHVYLNNTPILPIDSSYAARVRSSRKNLNRIYYEHGRTFLLTSGGLKVNDDYNLFVGQALSSITKDVFGNYWIGTLSNGLYKLPNGFWNNTTYDSVYKGELKYLTNVQNEIFFTLSDNNLYEWRRGAATEIFNHNKAVGSKATSDPFFFLSDRLHYYSFYGTQNEVVDNVNVKTATPKVYKSNLMFSGFKAMYEPEDHIVYIQNRYRMYKIAYRDLKVGEDVEKQQAHVSDTVFDNRMYCSTEDADHHIWYSSNRGLFRITKGQRQQISSILLKQFLFIGGRLVGYTHDNLLLVDKSVGAVSASFDTVRSGSCVWNKFYKIDSNHLLVSTNDYYRVLSITKGGPLIQVKDEPWIPLDAEGIICDSAFCYFFKDGNIISIRTNQLLAKQPPPIPLIMGIKAGNRQFLQSPRDKTVDIVEIPYDQSRNITIKFSVLSFNSNNVAYQYAISKNGRIEWVDASDDQVNLVNPGYGSYVVRVRAKTLSSDYSESKLIRLRILRPYWATWWFIGCLIILALGIIILFLRYRIRNIVKAKARENENKVRYLKSEYKALNALMNPHFIFNTLNNVQGLVNRDDKRAANEYLRIFADLVRQNMHNVSMEMISLEKELDLVKNYLLLEKLRFKENLHYKMSIADNVDVSEIMVPPLLIQPLVENSIKHGILPLESSSGIVRVDICEKDAVLEIRVADNGVGLNSEKHRKDSAHISFGLDNIRRRIEQLSAILEKNLVFEMKEEVVDNQRWTVAIITIPT